MKSPLAGAVLFDMDGLLIDSEPLWALVEADFALPRGGVFTREHATACVGRGLANTVRFMGSTFGFDVDVERDVGELVERFLARVGELALKPGAADLLDALGGRVPVALGSSSTRRLVLAALDAVGVRDRFPIVVCGDDVAHPKPAPDIFLKCAADLRVSPSECVVLEDSLAGAESGRAAGMRVLAVPEKFPWDPAYESVADTVVRDLFEARRHLLP